MATLPARAQHVLDTLRAHPGSDEMKFRALCEAADLLMPGFPAVLAAHARQGRIRVALAAMVPPRTPGHRPGPFPEADVLDIFAVLAGAGFATLEEDGTVLLMTDVTIALLSR